MNDTAKNAVCAMFVAIVYGQCLHASVSVSATPLDTVLFEAKTKSLAKSTLESKLASCRNFVKSPQREEAEDAAVGVTALGRTHLKQRALSSPQEFVPLAF
ncbi:uncharacterized protein LOC144111990 [Amblyomma americanum]